MSSVYKAVSPGVLFGPGATTTLTAPAPDICQPAPCASEPTAGPAALPVPGARTADSLNSAYAAYAVEPGERTLEAVVLAAEGLIHHFSHLFDAGFAADDLYQTGVMGLLKATRTFSPGHGAAFSTWASSCIIGELRHFARAEFRHRGVLPLEDELEAVEKGPAQAETLDARVDLANALERLGRLERRVLRALYVHGMTQEEAASMLGLHQRKISRVKQRALCLLRELLDQPNFRLTGATPSFHLMRKTKQGR